MFLFIIAIFAFSNLLPTIPAEQEYINLPTKVCEGVPKNWYDDLDTSPFIKIGAKYYFLSNETVSWFSAAHLCRQQKAELASILNAQEMHELTKYLFQHHCNGRWYWLSGNDLSQEGVFQWLGTGNQIQYANWLTGEPNNNRNDEHCIDLRHANGGWHMCDKHCKNLAYYICERNPPTTLSFTLW